VYPNCDSPALENDRSELGPNTSSVEINSDSVAVDIGIYFKFGHKVLICGGGVITVIVDADTDCVKVVFHPYRFSGLKITTEFVEIA